MNLRYDITNEISVCLPIPSYKPINHWWIVCLHSEVWWIRPWRPETFRCHLVKDLEIASLQGSNPGFDFLMIPRHRFQVFFGFLIPSLGHFRWVVRGSLLPSQCSKRLRGGVGTLPQLTNFEDNERDTVLINQDGNTWGEETTSSVFFFFGCCFGRFRAVRSSVSEEEKRDGHHSATKEGRRKRRREAKGEWRRWSPGENLGIFLLRLSWQSLFNAMTRNPFFLPGENLRLNEFVIRAVALLSAVI